MQNVPLGTFASTKYYNEYFTWNKDYIAWLQKTFITSGIGKQRKFLCIDIINI